MNIQVSRVYRSALKLMAPLTVEGTHAVIVQEAQKLVRAKYGSIYIFENGQFKRIFSTSPESLQVSPRENGYAYKAFLTRKTLCIPARKLAKAHSIYKNSNVKFTIIIPLTYESSTLGVVTLEATRDLTVRPNDLRILGLFGSLASLKIRNNLLFTELKEALETRDLFISMASHELKNPLTTTSAYAQLIQAQATKGKEIKPEWLETLLSATQRMTRMINELFDINQIKSGKMAFKFQQVDVFDVLANSITDFKSSFPFHTVLVVDKRASKEKSAVDADKLLQVFNNILNNAGKFSKPNKKITIELVSSDTTITVRITDQGPGIDAEELDRLFSEFYKGKKHSSEGLGLGLFISKRIIEAHGGQILVESEIKKGTTFTIHLPYGKTRRKTSSSTTH